MRTGKERAAADTPGDMKGNGMYYNECPQCGACRDPGEHCDCEEERQRQTARIMAMVRENKESHQMELVLN